MSKFGMLGPRTVLAVLGSVLGISGTAMALSSHVHAGGHAVRHSAVAHRAPAASHASAAAAQGGPAAGPEAGASVGSASGVVGGLHGDRAVLRTNRDCVYGTNRDCVYPIEYSVGSVTTNRYAAFIRVNCVSHHRCRIGLRLTVSEKVRGGRILEVTPSDRHLSVAHVALRGSVAHIALRGHHAHVAHRRHHHHGSNKGSHHRRHHGHGNRHRGRRHTTTRTVTVARGGLVLPGRHHATYRLTLDPSGRALLRHFGKLHARLHVGVGTGVAEISRAPAGIVSFELR